MSIIEPTRADWLADRMTALGASEIASIFGEGFETPYELWARKLGLIPATEETERMEIGTLLQDDIAELLRRRTSFTIIEASQNEFIRSKEHSFIGCTPDASAIDDTRLTEGVCEIKNVGHYLAREWEGAVPLRVQIQIQTQMYVMDCDWGIAAGFIGGNCLKWQIVERDNKFIAWMIPHVVEFRRRIVERDPPPVDGSKATSRILATIHPADNGECVMLPTEFVDSAETLESLDAQMKDMEERRELLRNQIREAIGGNSFGVLPDGSGWSWKSVTRKAHIVAESTSRTLRRTKAKGK
jgi:putative phage-type endonuclease